MTPRSDLRAPFRFRVRGTLTLPLGVAKSAGCSGRVSVKVRRGRRVIATRTVRLSRQCTYSVRITFADRRRLGRSTRLQFVARFRGNARVLARNAPARYVRIRH